MASIKELAEGRSDVFNLPISKISVKDGDNIRTEYGDIEGFAKRIAKRGLKNIFTVRVSDDGESAFIVDGHRRFKAVRMAIELFGSTITHIRCQNEVKGTNEEQRILDMLAFNDSKNLDPLEEGAAFHRLILHGWDPSKIAKETGQTVVQVNQRLALNAAPQDIRMAVKEGKLSVSGALEVNSAPMDEQEIIKEKIKATPKGKKVTIAEIQSVTKGVPNVISTKKAKSDLKSASSILKEIDKENTLDLAHWSGIVEGLEIALGMKKLDVKKIYQ